MPELPEVETVLRSLEKLIINNKIIDIEINYPKMIKTDVNLFKNNLINQSFNFFSRRGKYLILKTEDYILLSHMRMEGRYYYDKNICLKHIHIVFKFEDGNNLYYQDFRKFGTMALYNKDFDIESAINIGVDANSDVYDYSYFMSKVSNLKRSIKDVLLDQKIISGIGNIYADEICFRSKIHPVTACNKINKKEYKILVDNIKKVLNEAINTGVDSIERITTSIDGRFDISVINHVRDKKECINCGSKIIKLKHKGRGTYVCVKCQKLKV